MADRIVVIKDGVIEQVGSPVEIYQQPKSSFVADFIGTMNFFDAKIIDKDRIKIGDLTFSLKVDSEISIDENITAAIRPEEFVMSSGSSHSPSFVAVIAEIEFLGNLVRLTMQSEEIPGQAFIMSIDERTFREQSMAVNDKIKLAVIADPRIYKKH